MKFDVCFIQGNNNLIGVHWEFTDTQKIIDILESAHCRFKEIQEVRQRLNERRPGSIDIELTANSSLG
jgi:hypothetical protein